MAQIIASIERMEQEQRRAGGDSDGQQATLVPAVVQSAQTQHGKVGKGGARKKVRGRGRKLKVAPTMDTVAVERKLTPKKRWIQLWSAQLREVERPEDDNSTDTPAEHDEADEHEVVQQEQQQQEKTVTQQQVQVADKAADPVEVEAPKVESAANQEEMTPEVQVDEPAAPIETPIADSATTKEATETGTEELEAPATDDGAGLRVKTPLHAEASHLSPPVERSNSPAPASISPSAKVKEGESPPTSNTSSVATTDSASSESTVVPAQDVPKASEEKRVLVKASSTSSLVSDAASRKRSMERDLESLTPEERRREERRRKRKSNWDVGDPRFGGSPASTEGVGIPPGGTCRFPPGRPMWRHSSSLDLKQGGHFPPRSSFNNTGGPPVTPAGRRGFYHSTSMPLDRSRSAGRPARYSSSNNNNYSGGFR